MKVHIDSDEQYPFFDIVNEDHPYYYCSMRCELTDEEWRQVVYAMDAFRLAQRTLGKAYYKSLEGN